MNQIPDDKIEKPSAFQNFSKSEGEKIILDAWNSLTEIEKMAYEPEEFTRSISEKIS